MSKLVSNRALLLFVIILGAALSLSAQSEKAKSLTGKVLNNSDQPVANAIVYLKNTKTLSIKTFIAEQDGGFRFHALSPNVDYELYAELEGRKSDVKTISSFDTKPNVRINLKIDR